MRKIIFIAAIVLWLPAIHAKAQQEFRAPAYPLVTVDPYFSIWSFNDTLCDGPTRHWTGKENSLQGIIRVDGRSYYFLGQPIPEVKTVLPLAGKTAEWQYRFSDPGSGWNQPGLNTASWKTAHGAFSNGDDVPAPNKWNTPDIWVRREFRLDNADFSHLLLNLHHDDNVEVYLNGVLAYQTKGWNNAPALEEITPEARAALKTGNNLLAIHCANTAGGAYLDAGLIDRSIPESNVPKASQQEVKISATQTFYRFNCGNIALELKFTAPLLAGDPDLLSRPADYISFKVRSVDGKPHRVQLYFSAAGNIAVNTTDQPVVWQRVALKGLEVMRVGTAAQKILGRKGDDVRIDWGYLYLAAPKEPGTSTAMAFSAASAGNFISSGKLSIKDEESQPRPAGSKPVTLAASYDLGKVSSAPVSRHLVLAYDDIQSIEYFHQPLKAWWKRTGMTTSQMLEKAATDYAKVIGECDRFDHQLYEQTRKAGGEKYARICELAYRQSLAACKLAEGPDGNPLFFTKEDFSNGDISTVDVIYPSAPVLLCYNPVLMKAMTDPVFYYAEKQGWNKPYSPHDLGTYPIANGRQEEEAMPIEESGNMLILAAAIARAEGSAGYARKHWEVLTRWADFLLKNGMDPENQLCTDDFAGRSAHNANLSVKAIIGLACYGKLAGMIGKKDIETEYLDSARNMAKEWMVLDGDGDHYKLAFDRPGTWSQKYNLVWDKVLGLHIFPKEVARKEIAYYLTKQNAFGLPLDSRATYTKSDWINWTATLADRQSDFEKLIDPLYKYITETPSRVPISDWHQTINGKKVGFQARSVVGGYFMKTLDQKFNGHPVNQKQKSHAHR